ncbi:hypothetical protein IAT38_007059 [Cryptococcus sp. DSM 104549]
MASKLLGEPNTLPDGKDPISSSDPVLPLEKKKKIPKVAFYVAGSALALSLGLTVLVIPFMRQAVRANAAAIAAAELRAAQRAGAGAGGVARSLQPAAGAAPGVLGVKGKSLAEGAGNLPSYSHASMAAENPVDLAEMERIEQAEAAVSTSSSSPSPLPASSRPTPPPLPSHLTHQPPVFETPAHISSNPTYTHATLSAEEPLSPGEIASFERAERIQRAESASNLAELSAGTPSTPTSLPGTTREDDHHDTHPPAPPPQPASPTDSAPNPTPSDEIARLIAEDQRASQEADALALEQAELEELEREGSAEGRQLGAMTAAKAFGVATVLVWGVAGLGLWGVAKAVGAEDMDDLSLKMREQLATAMPVLASSVNQPGRSVDGFDGEAIDEWVAGLEREDELAERAELERERAAEAARRPS